MLRPSASLVLAVALALGVPGAAQASTTAGVGSAKCTITSLAPSLSGSTITAAATVVCTANTTVSVQIGVVEMDGTSEDTKTEITLTWKSVAVLANRSATVSIAGTCVSTETGNEELATKARVQLSSTVVSSYDRTSPKTDSYAC